MQTLTFNNTQLLFVGVPEGNENSTIGELTDEMFKDCKWIDLKTTQYLGTIQNEKGVVSTTIPDEVLCDLLEPWSSPEIPNLWAKKVLDILLKELKGKWNLELQEGEKYAVLKIK